MRIQHNITAMNAYRNYNTNTKALSGNLEKLSSGYKINRAGDDAAGLAISEKMRAQITGLDAAQKNVKDGISLVKTGEGAMQEIQDMLNRMDYLATQSANGTYQDEVDRENLQKEVEALKTEINRIADSANFNGINLLDGSLEKTAGGTIKTLATGKERILSSVAGKGEEGWQVAGLKTILDSTPMADPQPGSFTVDLTSLAFSVSASTATQTSATLTDFVLTVGDKTFDAVSTSATVDSMAAALAAAIYNAGATATINGIQWTVNAEDGVLSFTQKAVPKTEAQTRLNFDVAVTYTAPESDSTGMMMSNEQLHGTKPGEDSIAASDKKLASTTFLINESDITDGAMITIGTKTVTLRVGVNSKISATASGVVDLSNMEEGDINLDVALTKIGKAFAGTTNLKAEDAEGVLTDVGFHVGVNDSSTGKPTGITITRKTPAATGGALFNSKDKLAEAFKITKKQSSQTGLTLQIGDTADSFNQLAVSIGDMHTSAMGIGDIDISTQAGAQSAVQTIRDAINYVSSVRGDLGAVQNRLEHTGNNLAVMAENIQDAESTIRDTDVANEMMSYVKNNILVQSAQAMLAQANQLPQGVLQLLG